MSDQWGPSGDGSEWGRPDPDQAAPTPVEPSLTLQSEQAVTTGGGLAGGRVVAGIIGVLVLLGGAVFAITQAGSGGPSSAEDAVRELLDAASDEDVLGLLAALDPGEREALRDPVEDLFGELQRLEVLGEDFALDGVAGIDIEFTDVELREEPLRDDLVRVYFTGGSVTTGIDGDEVPLGAFVQDTLERFETDLTGLQESDTSQIEDDDTFLVARNGSDGWRVSIGYTAAEYARLGSGVPLPAEGLAAVGAESPEAAVEGMLRSAAELDLAGVIARLSPAEMRALHDYAPLFLDQAEQALAEASGDVDVSIDDLELRSDSSGDRGTVFVDAIGVTVTYEGDTVSVAMRDGCFEVSGSMVDDELEGTPFEDGPVCGDELTEGYGDLFGFSEDLEAEGFEPPEMPELPELPETEVPEIGIATARVDGQWYVAPVGTMLDGMVSTLSVLQRAHLDAAVGFVESFFLGFSSVETFEEVGNALEGDFYEAPDALLPGDSGDGAGDDEESGGPTATTIDGASAERFRLEEISLAIAGGDEAVASCITGELWFLDDALLVELIESWDQGTDPSMDVQDAVVAAIDACAPA